VRLVDLVPARFHGITRELAKFGTIGVVNVFVNIGVANVLVHTVFQGGEVKAKAVAAVVATTSAYFMNRHWTYRDRPKSTLRREYTLFFFFNLIGLLVESGSVAFTKYVLHETDALAFNLASGFGIALGTLFRFWAYRTHVFKTAEALGEEEPSAPVALVTALADSPETPSDLQDLDEPERAEAVPTRTPRIVVTSSAGGSVVIKVIDAAEELDEIDLDDPVRASS
jgi:putative flippase GtrA